MVKYGLHGFTAAYLLNCWFLVAIALPVGYHLSHGHTNAWAQALAWLIGSALTIAWTAIVWLARGRTAQQQPATDIIPGSTKPVPLTRPVILFALIRAIAVAIAVAIAFGFHLPDADWMPIACIISMKSSLAQSTLVGLQRAGRGDHRRRGGGRVPADRGHQDRPGSGHRHPRHPGRFHPRGQLRPVLRGTGREPCSSPRTCPTPPTLATRRAGCCSPSPASGSPSSSCCWPACSQARRQGGAEGGATGACSRGHGRMSRPGSRSPGARHTAPARAGITLADAGARTADGRAACQHGRDPASPASWPALTPSGHVAGPV